MRALEQRERRPCSRAPCGGVARGTCVQTAEWLRAKGRPGKARPYWWLGVGIYKCECTGNFYGEQCQIDGEVMAVAVGASVAAVIIIILTLVCLCMWR